MGCARSRDGRKAKYTITVTTNEGHKSAGSNSDVYIDMIGEDARQRTGWIKLDNILKDDFARGGKNTFSRRVKDVGIPLIIRLELQHRNKEDHWACDEVVVYYDGQHVAFPVYDWIEDESHFTKGKALTGVQVNHPTVKDLRKRECEERKAKFQWIPRPHEGDVGWALPRYVNTENSELPKLFHGSKEREKNLLETGFEAIVNKALTSIHAHITKLDDLEDFTALYRFLQRDEDPPFMDRWQTDEEFGRQQILGTSPISLCRCRRLPDGCQISHSHVQDSLKNGVILEQEIASSRGRVFIGDYSSVFQGVTRNTNGKGEQLYCPDAIGLFYVNDEQNLIPIAIQLVPNDPETIFTPKDSDEDWLLAKMYYRTASANLHEWYYHFMLTHGVMEPFSVALFRCLPRSHPIYKLLRPHLQTVSAINQQARESLIRPGTEANKALAIEGEDLARHQFSSFHIDDLVIPEVLQRNGLDDRELLPRNYHRDDALTLWVILERFISNIVHHYYSSDEDIANDEELQDYVRDVAEEGLGWHDGNTRGVPKRVSAIKDLVRLCTTVIYTSSAGHATVNFPQYQTYKFVPNAPTAMRLPPHKRGEATMKRIMDSLPNIDMSTTAITIAYVLSSYSPDEVYLGQYPMNLFTEPEVLEIIENFRAELRTFSVNIKQRNMYAGENAYPWLLPEKVPNSIAV